jgi:hypothetical protein
VIKILKSNDILTIRGAFVSEANSDSIHASDADNGRSSMTKIRAAGDEPDSWEARSEEEIRDAGLWDAVDFAAKEIENTDNAMIFENGLEWTRAWYELDLEKFTEPGTAWMRKV